MLLEEDYPNQYCTVWLVIGQVKGEALPLHAMKAYREK
jgi:hypothetical protein